MARRQAELTARPVDTGSRPSLIFDAQGWRAMAAASRGPENAVKGQLLYTLSDVATGHRVLPDLRHMIALEA
jgi:hypothetical protein